MNDEAPKTAGIAAAKGPAPKVAPSKIIMPEQQAQDAAPIERPIRVKRCENCGSFDQIVANAGLCKFSPPRHFVFLVPAPPPPVALRGQQHPQFMPINMSQRPEVGINDFCTEGWNEAVKVEAAP